MSENVISISEVQAFKAIIDQASLSRTKPPDYSSCLSQFVAENSLIHSEEVVTFFKASWFRYKRLKSKSKVSQAEILEKASQEVKEFERCSIISDEQSKPTKKQRKRFIDLGLRMQKERTESLLQRINEFVSKECPELSSTQLLGYLIYRLNIQSEKKLAKVGHNIFTSCYK